ncbi:MAG: toprim domain-containing protein [Acidithiobacillus sp.]|nr:toprim domain-containing protein [Acidithiobacillus sp.]
MGNLSDFARHYHEIGKDPVGFPEVVAAARGHWQSILPGLGVDAHALNGKHCACPGCGGKDRFRFDDKDGNGNFVCSQGSGDILAGDGFILLEHVHGWTRSESFNAVKGALGMASNIKHAPIFPGASMPENKPAPFKMDKRKELSKVKKMWDQAVPIKGTIAETYLNSRGILTDSIPVDADLRFHRWLTQYQSDGKGGFNVLHEGPAMVALVTNVHEEILGIHKTFIQPDGSGKANVPGGNCKFLKKCAEQLNGGSVRIHRPDPQSGMIGIGEGIESALAMHTITRQKGGILPVMAALNAVLLADWVPPTSARQIAILADNDQTGLNAAQKLQARLHQYRPDAATDILTPPQPGMDWNNVLQQKAPFKSASPR